jgi:hypothetical protein
MQLTERDLCHQQVHTLKACGSFEVASPGPQAKIINHPWSIGTSYVEFPALGSYVAGKQ